MTDGFGSWTGAALAGGLAGLGVAVPLGAVGVLLLEEGRRGRRAAVAAACAVACVDMLYAALATVLGARLAGALAGWEAWTRAGAALVLLVVAVRGLSGLRRPVEAVVGGGAGPGGARSAFLRFTGLTAVNPTTVLYFAALVAGGAAGGATGSVSGGVTGGVSGGADGFGVGVAFVVGVFVASLLWQQALAAVGVSLGARLSPKARRLTYCAGYGLVVYYAVRLALPQ